MKVALQVKTEKCWQAKGHHTWNIKMALPYYQSKTSPYVHRVRRGQVFLRDNQYSHTAIKYWCGNTGFLGGKNKGVLLAECPDNAVLCATCEGRAIGAGVDGSRKINGRMAIFAPKI